MLKIVVLSTAVRSTIPRGAYRDFGRPAKDDMHRRVSIENGKQHLLRNDIRRSHAVSLLRFPSLMSPLNLLPAYPFPSPQTPHSFPASDALIPCPMPTSSSCPSSPLHAPPLPPLAHPVLARTPLPSSHHNAPLFIPPHPLALSRHIFRSHPSALPPPLLLPPLACSPPLLPPPPLAFSPPLLLSLPFAFLHLLL